MEDAVPRLVLVIGIGLLALVAAIVILRRQRIRDGRDESTAGPSASHRSPGPRLNRAQRKAAALSGTTPVLRPDFAEAEARGLAAAARLAGREPDPPDNAPAAAVPPPEAAPSPPPEAADDGSPSLFRPSEPQDVGPGPRVHTVAELLAGIRLPEYLAPLTEMAPRSNVLDRVAFIATGPSADVVAPAFAAELQRLGFTTTPEGYNTLTITRGPDRATVVVHAAVGQALIEGEIGFPASLPYAVVVEIWIPAEL